MPNGKPGDHPYTDIVVHGRVVYSCKATRLVREITELANDAERRRLADLLFLEYNEFSEPDVRELERVLTKMHDTLLRRTRSR